VHSNGWGCEGIVVWEDESTWAKSVLDRVAPRAQQEPRTPVLTAIVGCVWRSRYDVMPLKYVRFGWMCDNVWWRALAYVLVFSRQTLGSGCWRHCGACQEAGVIKSLVEREYSVVISESLGSGKQGQENVRCENPSNCL